MMVISTSLNECRFELRKVVENKGDKVWEAVMLEADFFDKVGNFVNEAKTTKINIFKEHSRVPFKVTLLGLCQEALKLNPRVRLTYGHTQRLILYKSHFHLVFKRVKCCLCKDVPFSHFDTSSPFNSV